MDIIATDTRVIEALGTPVRAGYWLTNKSNRKMMRVRTLLFIYFAFSYPFQALSVLALTTP